MPRMIWIGAAAAAVGQAFLVRFDVPWTLWPGLAFFAFAVLLFNRGVPGASVPTPEWNAPLPVRQEWLYLAVVALFIVGLRVYRASELPPGIFLDSASIGVGGLRVLHEHWRPITPGPVFPHPGLIYYLSASWFLFFPNTQTSLTLFLVFVSLWQYPFIYWVGRQLVGPKTALLALSLLAMAHWDFSFARRGHTIEHVGFYVFAALALWLYARRSGKRWPLYYLAAVFALGFYTYHSYKAFPILIALLLLYEMRNDPALFRNKGRDWALAGLIAAILLLPMIGYWSREGFLNPYERGLSILRYAGEPHGFQAFLKGSARTLLMFNRKGDDFILDNSGSHRMLDDVTGILWVLGLGVALVRWRERRFFYPLAGLAAFSLNGLLTHDPAQGNRMLNTLPFITLMAAYPLGILADSLKMRSGNRWARSLPGSLLALSLALCYFQNFQQYFRVQARDPACWRVFDVEPTDIGRRVARDGGDYDFHIASRYANHNTVRFLAYKHRESCSRMDLPADLSSVRVSPGKRGVCFVLDEGKWGVRDLLGRRYPRCRVEVFPVRDGRALITYLYVDREDLEKVRTSPGREKGLRGEFWRADGPAGLPAVVRWDPLVNYTYRTDLPWPDPPLFARWKGTLLVPVDGVYQFLTLTEPGDRAAIHLDGLPLTGPGPSSRANVPLRRGKHRIEVDYQMGKDFFSSISLAWKRPGKDGFEIVSEDFFGSTSPRTRGRGTSVPKND